MSDPDGDTAAEGKPPVPKPTRSVPKPPSSQPAAESKPDTAEVLREIFDPPPEPHERRRYIILGVVSAVMAVAGLLIAIVALRRKPVEEQPTTPIADPPASSARATVAGSAVSPPSTGSATSASATTTASVEAPPKPRVVTFRAKRELLKLRYGRTTIAITPPRSIVVLSIAGEEDLPIEAVAVDGRIFTTTLPAGSSNVTVELGGAHHGSTPPRKK